MSQSSVPKGRPTQGRRDRDAAARAARTRKRTQVWIVFALGAAAIIAVVVLAVGSSQPAQGSTDATGFDLPGLYTTSRVRLADFRGKPTVVNMFASWCTQCEAELPEFHRVAAALKGKVNFVFINSNETRSGRDMADRHHLADFTVAKDIQGTRGNGLYRSLGGTGGMPMTAFYSADGQLLDVARGALVGDGLDQAIKQLYAITV